MAEPPYPPTPPHGTPPPPGYGDRLPYPPAPAGYGPPPGYGAPPGYGPPPGYPPVAPGPDHGLVSGEERTLGMAAHLVPLAAMVLSVGALGFVASLVLYLYAKERGEYARLHAANGLNVQIVTAIVLLVSLPLMLVLVGFLTYGLALVWAFVVHVVGAVKASNGQRWDPPLTPRLVR